MIQSSLAFECLMIREVSKFPSMEDRKSILSERQPKEKKIYVHVFSVYDSSEADTHLMFNVDIKSNCWKLHMKSSQTV